MFYCNLCCTFIVFKVAEEVVLPNLGKFFLLHICNYYILKPNLHAAICCATPLATRFAISCELTVALTYGVIILQKLHWWRVYTYSNFSSDFRQIVFKNCTELQSELHVSAIFLIYMEQLENCIKIALSCELQKSEKINSIYSCNSMQLASNSVQLELRQNCMLIYMQQLPSALIGQLVANRVASGVAQQVAACKLGFPQVSKLILVSIINISVLLVFLSFYSIRNTTR